MATAALSIGVTNRFHIVGAGRSAKGAPCISLWDENGNGAELWKGAEPCVSDAADIVALSPKRLLCLLPGHGIVEIDGRRSTIRWRADALDTFPARMFTLDGEPVALFRSDAGETSFSAVNRDSGKSGKALFGASIAGPRLVPGQAVSLALLGDKGRMVVAVDDCARGFCLYRRDGNDWTAIIQDGAARYAFNAAVQGGCWWGDKAVMAVGLSPVERQRMLGFSAPGELLLADPEGDIQILCGEGRTSQHGFMSPLIGAAHQAAWAQGTFTHLAAAEDTLIAALRRDSGGAEIYAFTKDGQSEQLSELDGAVCGVFRNRNEFIIAVAEAPPDR